ncbi:uncharacterized protein LOC118753282 [Rhagoletis pomonella]|uniref:uncharacterized protein LOC118753282 n=1 Tax=Rhagoletis pomonella TaxID=28610 RepID=UPI00177B90C7|nr:uncharacterized protein LOC118753282 [Rhagoletis pomonella]
MPALPPVPRLQGNEAATTVGSGPRAGLLRQLPRTHPHYRGMRLTRQLQDLRASAPHAAACGSQHPCAQGAKGTRAQATKTGHKGPKEQQAARTTEEEGAEDRTAEGAEECAKPRKAGAATTAQKDRPKDDRAHPPRPANGQLPGFTTNRVLGNTIRALKELQKTLSSAFLQGGENV